MGKVDWGVGFIWIQGQRSVVPCMQRLGRFEGRKMLDRVKRFAMRKSDSRHALSVPVPSDGPQTGEWQFWMAARSSDGGSMG